jgi:hypothetical protein
MKLYKNGLTFFSADLLLEHQIELWLHGIS